MPLSEDEQRILQEIERSFYENDPAFAREVGSAPLTRTAARNCKLSAAAFVVGLVVLLAGFTRSPILGFAGFLVMLWSAFVFQHNMRRLSSLGWQQVASTVRSRGVGDAMGRARKRVRSRFKRRG